MKRFILASLLPLAFAESVAPLGTYTPLERKHWAFQPHANPAVPSFQTPEDRNWARNPIDAFILAKLQKEGMRPAPPAAKEALLRRVSMDLTGLPPTPAEIRAFLADGSAKAYEHVVDRLLASPRYGERWGQHWLDVARFSETDGFEYDAHRNGAWRFRDWVIASLNSDKPYNEFILEQLAGDEIAANDQAKQSAAGFQRLGPLRKNAGNQEVASSRNEVLTEMTNAVGSSFLGVTLGCARCHDHKFDPIRQSDYYRIQGYFAATWEKDVDLATPAERDAWNKLSAKTTKEIRTLKEEMKGKMGSELADLEKKMEDLNDQLPPPPPALFTVENKFDKVSPINLLPRGDYSKPGDKVGMRPLGVLLPDGTAEKTSLENPRTKLAEWITDVANPLPSRVMVNRLWLGHFGRGLVATPNDFGRMGEKPSHPDLLDYLANQFIAGGWKMKPMHKMLVMSNTYRQSSHSPNEKVADEQDPENKLLWHFGRRRLEAEEMRDAMLAASGLLNTKMGGAGVIVPVEKDLINLLYKPSQWTVAADKTEHDRRSVYLIAKRNLRLPFMEVFDAPDLQSSCARREASTHAPQALELMNGELSNRLAEALAARITKEAGPDRSKQLSLAYLLTAGREPKPKERELALAYLNGSNSMREFALTLLNLNAFLYLE